MELVNNSSTGRRGAVSEEDSEELKIKLEIIDLIGISSSLTESYSLP